MSIVVTGATGLIGRHVVPLLRADHEIVAFSRHVPQRHGDIGWTEADLSRGSIPSLPPDCEIVIHLAQSRRLHDFPSGARDMFSVNVDATAQLLESAREVKARTFVLASTGSVYRRSEQPLNEDASPTVPFSYYASTKLAAEQLALPYATMMRVIVLRFFFVYGRGQDRSMLIPRLVDHVAAHRPVRLTGDQQGLRLRPTHASDAAASIQAALQLDRSSVINVAGPEVLSLRDVANTIGSRLSIEPLFQLETADEHGDVVADTSRMEELLGPAKVHFNDGVADAIADR